MRALFSSGESSVPRLSRWTLLWVCLAVVVALLVAWEVMEHTFFSHLDPKLMHRLYLWRDVLGATVTTLIAVRVVFTNWERAQGEITKRDRFLASIVDNAGDAIVVLDHAGDIIFWNRAAEETLGYPASEAVGKNFLFFAARELASGERFSRFMKMIKEKGVVRNYEAEELTRKGERILVNLTATQIRDPQGKFLGTSILMQDITEHKHHQDRATQSDRVGALSTLAASIAHEIGTPLNVISGNAEYLLKGSDAASSPGRELNIVIREAERISKLIKRLMHLTQPQALHMRECLPNTIVTKVTDFTAHEMEKSRIELVLHLEQGLPRVMGDADQLEQVILNMVMNAIQAMPQGGRLSVSTSLWYVETRKNPVVQVQVSDTGVGIPKEVVSKIFDPFFSTKKGGGSRGLGLSISYRIIEDHKGTMRIESVPDRGTSVTIRIPSIIPE